MKTNLWLLLIILSIFVISFAAISCGDDDDDDDSPGDDDDDDDDNDTAPKELTFATYNAGLAYGFVPLGEARRTKLFESVPEVDADFLCMQEVWQERDITGMIDGLSEEFPYLHRHDSIADYANVPPEAEPRCESLDLLYSCVDTNCDTSQPEGLLDCAFDNCMLQLALSILQSGMGCLECMAGNIDRPFDDIYDICTTPSPPPVSYEGSNGLLLFSKYEMTEMEWTEMDFWLIVRGVLHAKVETNSGPLHLYCTHLTASISILPYFGDFESYEAEQLYQIQTMNSWIQETSNGEPYVMMGDYNNGPGTGGNEPEFPNNYQALMIDGRIDPYAEQLPDTCTYCDANPLNEEDLTGDGGVIIDHLFFKGFGAFDFTSERIFDEPITVSTDGGDVQTMLSDHYGVRVTTTPQ